MSKWLEKYRKEAQDRMSSIPEVHSSWRTAILESIFKPTIRVGGGRAPMTHLHPEHHKLHLPKHAYIADWRKYRVEDHEILVNFQKRCHAAGLHDPWLRNYAYGLYPNHMHTRSLMRILTTQLSWGFTAALIVFIGQKTYLHYYPYVYEHTPEYVEKYGNRELH